MSIVGGLFRAAGLGTLVDGLESQGILRAGERVLPTTFPEMFIGKEGISNLGKAGVPDTDQLLKSLDDAKKDWLRLSTDEWNQKWADSGFAYDPIANKAMMEISDANVQLKKGINLNDAPADAVATFDELFNAEVLKKAFPEVGETKIGFMDNPASQSLAAFSPSENTVYFNRQHPQWNQKDVKSTVLHEIQHYVQGKELFTQGQGFDSVLQSNVVFQDAISQVDKGVATSEQEIKKFIKKNPNQGFTYDNVSQALAALVRRDDAPVIKSLEKEFKSKELAQKFLARATEFPKLDDILFAKETSREEYRRALGDYMRVAGEVFARQTGERADMTAAQRLASPAMRNIDVNPTNTQFNVNTNNMTAPIQAATAPSFADPFQAQVPQSTIPGI